MTFLREFATCFRSFADDYKGKKLDEIEHIYMEVREYDSNKNSSSPYKDFEPKTHKQISTDSFGNMLPKKMTNIPILILSL